MTSDGGLPKRFAEQMGQLIGPNFPTDIGVAVSGGGDSMALLALTVLWAAEHDVVVHAATVDHRLRPAAATEAADVAQWCGARGIAHTTLVWQDWDGTGNLQAAARNARRRLLEDWAGSRGIGHILLGHTTDDQAETVLLRLARGSGVAGLAAMAAVAPPFLRPLLGERRAALRDWLHAEGIRWIDDPSNDDLQFDRIKARQMMQELGQLGLTPERLVRTAGHMRRANTFLRTAAIGLATQDVVEDGGELSITDAILQVEDDERAGRILSAAIRWIGGGIYPPDFLSVVIFAAGLRAGQGMTLGGVCGDLDYGMKGRYRLWREPSRVAPPDALDPRAVGCLWDQRWHVSRRDDAPFGPGLTIRAWGRFGLAVRRKPRADGFKGASLPLTPSIWRGDDLVAAPVAAPNGVWTARITPNFRTFLIGD